MGLSVDRLRVLVEVARAGSIAEAARRLAFTPSALSQQLSRLEREVGARLLDRRANGVQPTAVGAVLIERGERVLGELYDAQEAVRAAIGDLPPRLAVGSFSTAAQVIVPPALATLQQRHRAAELSLVDLEPPHGYGLVRSGTLDLLINHHYPGVAEDRHPGLDRKQLLADPLRLALPARHRLQARAASRGIKLDDLADDTWVCGGPGVPSRSLWSHWPRPPASNPASRTKAPTIR